MEKEFLEKFESNVNDLVGSAVSFKNKIEKISWLLTQECDYWNKKGEDGVLSKMTIFCGTAVENCVNSEISGIKNRHEDKEIQKRLLNDLKNEITKLPWLPRGFQSSINLKLSFAKVL